MTDSLKIVTTHSDGPPDPFADLSKLRVPQDYAEFATGETTAPLSVRTLKKDKHIRINPDPAHHLRGVYLLERDKTTYLVLPEFAEALGDLPRLCDLFVAVDGHGEYFFLQIKRPNPGQEDNSWYESAAIVAAAAMKGWVKVEKPGGKKWGYSPTPFNKFDPAWPTKMLKELLAMTFPDDRLIGRWDHDVIKDFEARGA
jgi:hypothetical protein